MMYEDSMLPVYVNYIGSIMPLLDQQSIATNWPPTPHPTSGQVRLMPFNSANLPTVPNLLNVGSSRLLPEPIHGAPALSEVAFNIHLGIQGDSVATVMSITPHVTFPPSTRGIAAATTLVDTTKSIVSTEQVRREETHKPKEIPEKKNVYPN